MSKDFLIHELYLSKVWGQWIKIMHQRGDAKISRRRRSEEGEGECFAPFYLKIDVFCIKMLFFWSWNDSGLIWDHFWKIVKNSNFHQNFDIFWWHISSPSQVFPWSNRAHIKPAQSSNIVLDTRLRISWFMGSIYQKYGAKGSKKCNSAGTPKSAEGAAVRKVKESALHHFI